LGTSAWAEDVCTVERSFGAFLESVSRSDPYRPLTQSERMEILSSFRNLDEAAINTWLAEPDRSTLRGPVAGVLDAGRSAAISGSADALVILQAHIRRFEVGMAGLCSAPAETVGSGGEKAEKLPGHGGPVEQATMTEETPEVAEDNLDLTWFWRVLAASVVLGVVVQMLMIAMSWWKAKLFRRQGCRVRADLKIGRERIESHIIVLGRKGSLVEPRDRYAFEKLDRLAGAGPEKLLVAGKEFACKITHVDNHGAGVKFDTELGLIEQRGLLKLSVITPFLILGDAVQNGKYPWWHRALMRLGILPVPAGSTQLGTEEEGEAIQHSVQTTEVRIRHPKRPNSGAAVTSEAEEIDVDAETTEKIPQDDADSAEVMNDAVDKGNPPPDGEEPDDANTIETDPVATEPESEENDPEETAELSEAAAVARAVFMPRSSRARVSQQAPLGDPDAPLDRQEVPDDQERRDAPPAQ
jgi:hypothetical protein